MIKRFLSLGLYLGIFLAAADAGATYYGFTVGFEVREGCPGFLQGDCEEPMFAPYDREEQQWWYDLVEELAYSGVQYIAPVLRGCSPCGDRQAGDMCPLELDKLVKAIRDRGLSDVLKVAIFDDTAAYAAQKNICKHGGGGYDPPFDLADRDGAGEGGWSYFWNRNYRIFYEVVPDDLLFRIDGKPLVITWSLSDAFFTNQEGNASDLLLFLRQKIREEFGHEVVIVVDGSWVDEDGSITEADVEGVHRWFDPTSTGYTKTLWNGKYWTAAVPGFKDHPASEFRRLLPRDHGGTFTAALEASRDSYLVLVEGFTDIAESAGLYRSYAWDFPSQYLTIMRQYAKPGASSIKLEAEAADGYNDTTEGNTGGAYRVSGDLDVQPAGDGLNWSVGWVDAGEWLEFRDVRLAAGRYGFKARYAAVENDRRMHVEVDGAALETASLPQTGDWQIYDDASLGAADISAAAHAIRIVFDTANVNLDSVSILPEAAAEDEKCDGRDNDLDGLTDEGLSRECATECGKGAERCEAGRWTGCTAPRPSDETCNGRDDDCDGETDEIEECGVQDAGATDSGESQAGDETGSDSGGSGKKDGGPGAGSRDDGGCSCAGAGQGQVGGIFIFLLAFAAQAAGRTRYRRENR